MVEIPFKQHVTYVYQKCKVFPLQYWLCLLTIANSDENMFGFLKYLIAAPDTP
jgi:hypothetical protein